MLQVRSHFDDRAVPVEGMPGQQRRVALLEKGQLRNGLAQNAAGERREKTAPLLLQSSQLKDKRNVKKKNINEMGIGLKKCLYLQAKSEGEISVSARKAFLSSEQWNR